MPKRGSGLLIFTALAFLWMQGAAPAQDADISEYLTQLNFMEAPVRGYAAYALGELEAASAVDALLPLLEDPDAMVRSVVAEALGKIGDLRATEALSTALQDSERRVRWKAAHALKQLQAGVDAEHDLLLADLSGASASLRQQAAAQLAHREPAKAVYYQGLRATQDIKDSDATVRASAALTLGRLGDNSVIPLLTEGLRDASATVRRNSASGLGEMIARSKDMAVFTPALSGLVDLIPDPALMVSDAATSTLMMVGQPAIQPLSQGLGNASSSLRAKLVDTLVRLDAANATQYRRQQALADLTDGDRSARLQALVMLATIADSQDVPVLMSLLADSDGQVREQASRAISLFGATAIPGLLTHLQSSDQAMRQRALQLLVSLSAQLTDMSTLEPAAADLAPLFTEGQPPINSLAESLLRGLGDAATPALVPLLGAPASATRARVHALLTQLDPANAAQYDAQRYQADLKDTDANIRLRAVRLLTATGGISVASLIQSLGDADLSVQQSAMVGLNMIGPAAIGALLPVLDDADTIKQANAQRCVLQLVPDLQATELQPLVQKAIAMLDSTDASERINAETILSRTGKPSVAPLVSLLAGDDPQLASIAGRLLVQAGRDALQATEPLLSDPSRPVRLRALAVLGQIAPEEIDAYRLSVAVQDLQDGETRVRSAAALELGNLGDSRGVDPLIAALQDADFRVRVNSASALAFLGDKRAVVPLEVLEDKDTVDMVKRVAKESLEWLKRLK